MVIQLANRVFPLFVLICLLGSCSDEDILPPIVITTISPSNGETTTVFQINTSGTINTNTYSEVFYRIDWESDGLWDTKYSHQNLYKKRFYEPGTYQVTIEAINTEDLLDTCQRTIVVARGYSKPRAAFSVFPESGNRLDTFLFDASITEDDEDSLDMLLFRWDYEGDGIWNTRFQHDCQMRYVFGDVGKYEPRLEVKDPMGFVNECQIQLPVDNINQQINIEVTRNKDVIIQGDTVVFDASLSKNLMKDDDRLKYQWKVDFEDWTEWSSSPFFSYIFLEEKGYKIELKVMDGFGLEQSRSQLINVYYKNLPPKARCVPGIEYGSLETVFYFSALQSRDDLQSVLDLEIRWDFNGDGSWEKPWGHEMEQYHIFGEAGIHTVTIEVRDGEGLTDTFSSDIRVDPFDYETGSFMYDHIYYGTVRIGEQWWMAENLAKIVPPNRGPFMYSDYGIMYSYLAMTNNETTPLSQGCCPDGWHIPSKEDWEYLFESIEGQNGYDALRPGGWTGLSLDFCGYATVDNKFHMVGKQGHYWSSTKLVGDAYTSAWSVTIDNTTQSINTGYISTTNLSGVRCIRD